MSLKKDFAGYLQHFIAIINEALAEFDITVDAMMVGYSDGQILANITFECGSKTFMSDAQLEQMVMDVEFEAMMSAFEDTEVENEQEVKLLEKADEAIKDIDDFWD